MWVEIILRLVTGLVVTPEARGLVRRKRNQRTSVYVNVRNVGVGRLGVCMVCTYVSEKGGDEKSSKSEVSEDLSLLSYTLRYVSLVDLGRLCQFGL